MSDERPLLLDRDQGGGVRRPGRVERVALRRADHERPAGQGAPPRSARRARGAVAHRARRARDPCRVAAVRQLLQAQPARRHRPVRQRLQGAVDEHRDHRRLGAGGARAVRITRAAGSARTAGAGCIAGPRRRGFSASCTRSAKAPTTGACGSWRWPGSSRSRASRCWSSGSQEPPRVRSQCADARERSWSHERDPASSRRGTPAAPPSAPRAHRDGGGGALHRRLLGDLRRDADDREGRDRAERGFRSSATSDSSSLGATAPDDHEPVMTTQLETVRRFSCFGSDCAVVVAGDGAERRRGRGRGGAAHLAPALHPLLADERAVAAQRRPARRPFPSRR